MNNPNITILSSEEEINNHLAEIQKRKPVIAKDNLFSKEMVKSLIDGMKELKEMVDLKGIPSVEKIGNVLVLRYEDSMTIIYPEES